MRKVRQQGLNERKAEESTSLVNSEAAHFVSSLVLFCLRIFLMRNITPIAFLTKQKSIRPHDHKSKLTLFISKIAVSFLFCL